jgi:hypothetical protein
MSKSVINRLSANNVNIGIVNLQISYFAMTAGRFENINKNITEMELIKNWVAVFGMFPLKFNFAYPLKFTRLSPKCVQRMKCV